MKTRLLIAILIAAAAAFFASQSPDGLDKVSETLGFAERGRDGAAVMADYSVNIPGNQAVSTIIAGSAGLLLSCGMFLIPAYIMRSRREKATGLSKKQYPQS